MIITTARAQQAPARAKEKLEQSPKQQAAGAETPQAAKMPLDDADVPLRGLDHDPAHKLQANPQQQVRPADAETLRRAEADEDARARLRRQLKEKEKKLDRYQRSRD
jgi:hypothetical protein